MIKLKNLSNDEIKGWTLVILWIFSISFTHSTHSGDHLHFGLGVGPLEVFLGFSIWKKWAI